MPTVVKTWTFDADAEGLADAGLSAAIAFAFVSGDGDPANGCVRFLTSGAATASEKARRASAGQTWEDWGVPAGGNVSSVQITGWKYKTGIGLDGETYRLRARIVDSGAASVHSAGELIDSPVEDGTGFWQAGDAGESRAVDAPSAPSTSDVRLELEWELAATVARDLRLDSIELTITYTEAGDAIGFVITPSFQTTLLLLPTPDYTIALVGGVAPAGGQSFLLSSTGAGTFAPYTLLTIAEGDTEVTFTYAPRQTGVQTLTAEAVGDPYAVNQQTALCITGDIMSNERTLVTRAGMELYTGGYLFLDDSVQNDIPIGEIQAFTFDRSINLTEVAGPEQNTAIGVGIAGREYSGSFEGLVITPEMLEVLDGATISTRTAIANPSTVPTLAAGTSGGSITSVSNETYYAVGYAWMSAEGESTVKYDTVQLTAGSSRKITVTPPSLPTGATGVRWYMTPTGYLTAALAAAAAAAGALRLTVDRTDATAYDITTVPATTARRDLTFSQIATAAREAVVTATSVPQKVRLQASNAETGTEIIIWGVIINQHGENARLGDFVRVNGSFRAFGDSNAPPQIYKRVFPLGI